MKILLSFLNSLNLTALVEWIIGSLAFVFTLILSVYSVFRLNSGLTKTIEERINKIIEHPDYIRKIASLVKPTVIFNGDGSILHDLGGMTLIKEIRVDKGIQSACPGNLLFPTAITVSPIKHMANAPIITCNSDFDFQITESRAKGFDWLYKLTMNGYSTSEDGQESLEVIFRMEIIP